MHGRGLAALTPIITEMSVGGAPEKFAEISRCLGGTDEKDCAERINTLLSQIDLKITLGEQGIKEEDVDWMVDNFLRYLSEIITIILLPLPESRLRKFTLRHYSIHNA